MRRSRRNDNDGNPLSKRRGRSLWARLERPSLWVAFGLLGGACAGAMSLEPRALERLTNAVPSWSSHAPNGAGPLAASDVQVTTAPVAPAVAAVPVVAPHPNVAKPLV